MTTPNPFENATIDDVFATIAADAERSARNRARTIAWAESVAHLDIDEFFAAAAEFTVDLDDLRPL